jgi:hypothetical protein
MEPTDAAIAIAGPLGAVAGATFYFSPQSTARAEAIGIDAVTLYAAGRGAVLGEATTAEVDDTFFFFRPGMIAGLVEAGRRTATVPVLLAAHLAAADDFALATFGTIGGGVLRGFDSVAATVVVGLPTGVWPLVDGYRAAPVPDEPMASAFRRAILLRELRGGVHREAVAGAGLSAAVACQLDRGDDYFLLHGYGDEHRVADTPDVRAAKAAAEEATNTRMGELLAVLDGPGLDALVAGAVAMDEAWRAPVPIS